MSPFHCFWRWSEWLYDKVGRTDAIALPRLMQLLFEFLTVERRLDPKVVAACLWRDYQRGGRRDKPAFLKEFIADPEDRHLQAQKDPLLPKRQSRHNARLSEAGLAQASKDANMRS